MWAQAIIAVDLQVARANPSNASFRASAAGPEIDVQIAGRARIEGLTPISGSPQQHCKARQ
eukprot:7860230-Alexandrium_andersonii.AAC.1